MQMKNEKILCPISPRLVWGAYLQTLFLLSFYPGFSSPPFLLAYLCMRQVFRCVSEVGEALTWGWTRSN